MRDPRQLRDILRDLQRQGRLPQTQETASDVGYALCDYDIEFLRSCCIAPYAPSANERPYDAVDRVPRDLVEYAREDPLLFARVDRVHEILERYESSHQRLTARAAATLLFDATITALRSDAYRADLLKAAGELITHGDLLVGPDTIADIARRSYPAAHRAILARGLRTGRWSG